MTILALSVSIVSILFCAVLLACSKEHNQELKQWVVLLKSKGGSE